MFAYADWNNEQKEDKMTFNKSIVSVLCLLTLCLFALGACNTIDGAGQDIENAGEAVQDAAD